MCSTEIDRLDALDGAEHNEAKKARSYEATALAPGWDMHHLENEWRFWVHEKAISVKDPDKHFLSFCKKRGAYKR